jgi:pyrrolysine biosynthesis protein PylC
MRLAVIGGKLQGLEATYLAHQAGWEVILIDKNREVPAAGLCDEFQLLDISAANQKALARILRRADLVLPALEDYQTLVHIENENGFNKGVEILRKYTAAVFINPYNYRDNANSPRASR